ncbi:MAG: ABC transporter substrate-binding protein [Propionibacteriaceae bacterium]|nr:ABC transporter substrate-binding protein [Propionibacteriaceae bacterium]
MKFTSPRRKGAFVALAASAAVLLAACSGGAAAPAPASTPGAAGAPAETTQLTVGLIPIVDTGAFRLGVEKGFFSERGLDITVQDAQGGAAIVPAVMSGSNQIGFSNLSSVIVAHEKNLPVRLIAAGVATTGDTSEDFGGVVAKPESGITSAKDLAGKTVAVNTLKNIGEVLVRYGVEQDGGDASAVQFVEMAFPDMAGQLAGGNIDAAWTVEPYTSITKGQGASVIDYNLAGFDANLQIGGFFTSTQYATQNPEVITAFDEGLKESNEYATANPEELREFLSTYTKLDPEVQKVVVLPKWPTSIDQAALQKLADEGQKYGMTEGAVDTKGLLG